ncbi:hypothetical protein Agub_g6750, partial [Astrephomene gubernaculifera]
QEQAALDQVKAALDKSKAALDESKAALDESKAASERVMAAQERFRAAWDRAHAGQKRVMLTYRRGLVAMGPAGVAYLRLPRRQQGWARWRGLRRQGTLRAHGRSLPCPALMRVSPNLPLGPNPLAGPDLLRRTHLLGGFAPLVAKTWVQKEYVRRMVRGLLEVQEDMEEAVVANAAGRSDWKTATAQCALAKATRLRADGALAEAVFAGLGLGEEVRQLLDEVAAELEMLQGGQQQRQ